MDFLLLMTKQNSIELGAQGSLTKIRLYFKRASFSGRTVRVAIRKGPGRARSLTVHAGQHVNHVTGTDLPESGRGNWIRTNDLVVPNDALYQAELYPEARNHTQPGSCGKAYSLGAKRPVSSSSCGISSSHSGLRKLRLMPRASLPICMPSTIR